MREPVRELGARGNLDVGGEFAQNVVEHRDLLAGIVAGTGREQIGDAEHDAQTALGVAIGDGFVKFIDQGEGSGRGGNIADKCSIGHEKYRCL